MFNWIAFVFKRPNQDVFEIREIYLDGGMLESYLECVDESDESLFFSVCIKGSDKPLDMVLVVDSSESVAPVFDEQILFAIDRVMRNIHVHPDAVRWLYSAKILYTIDQSFIVTVFNYL